MTPKDPASSSSSKNLLQKIHETSNKQAGVYGSDAAQAEQDTVVALPTCINFTKDVWGPTSSKGTVTFSSTSSSVPGRSYQSVVDDVMLILQLYETVLCNRKLLIAVIVAQISSVLVMMKLNSMCLSMGAGPIPDLRFGFSSEEIYNIFEDCGYEGRQNYLRLALFDFMPYIPAYTICMGSLLFHLLRLADWNVRLSVIMVFGAFCDYIETMVLVIGCFLFPQRLSENAVVISDSFNRIKWILVAIEVVLFLSASVAGWKRKASLQGTKAA